MNRGLIKLFRCIGLSNVAAHVLSTLLLENKPLSLDELSDKSGYAKSHISSALTLLENMVLIEKIHGKRRKLLVKVNENIIRRLLKEHLVKLKKILHRIHREVNNQYISREASGLAEELSKLIDRLDVRGRRVI